MPPSRDFETILEVAFDHHITDVLKVQQCFILQNEVQPLDGDDVR